MNLHHGRGRVDLGEFGRDLVAFYFKFADWPGYRRMLGGSLNNGVDASRQFARNLAGAAFQFGALRAGAGHPFFAARLIGFDVMINPNRLGELYNKAGDDFGLHIIPIDHAPIVASAAFAGCAAHQFWAFAIVRTRGHAAAARSAA